MLFILFPALCWTGWHNRSQRVRSMPLKPFQYWWRVCVCPSIPIPRWQVHTNSKRNSTFPQRAFHLLGPKRVEEGNGLLIGSLHRVSPGHQVLAYTRLASDFLQHYSGFSLSTDRTHMPSFPTFTELPRIQLQGNLGLKTWPLVVRRLNTPRSDLRCAWLRWLIHYF